MSRLRSWLVRLHQALPRFDIDPLRRRRQFTPSNYKNVEEALRSDWGAIGRDLHVILRADEKDIRIKPK